MPMKITYAGRIPVHRKKSAMVREYLRHYNDNCNHASGLIKNEPVSRLENIIFSLLDKYSLFLGNYPAFGDKVIKLSEKVLKRLHNNQVL